MKTLLMLTLFVASAYCGMVDKKMMDMVKNDLLMADCWGEEASHTYYMSVVKAVKHCEQEDAIFSVSEFFPQSVANRVARQSNNPDLVAKISTFAEEIGDMKLMKTMYLSNLTCVMQELKQWDSNNNVNIEFLTGDMWNDIKMDKELKEEMIDAMKKCDKFSRSIPEEVLDHPIYKKFGRQMKFQKCSKKMEAQLCAKKHMLRWAEKMFDGEFDVELFQQLGAPPKKYDAAFVTILAKGMMKSKTQKKIMEFLF